MAVTFDYEDWNPATESIPRRGAQKRRTEVTEPFADEDLRFAMFSAYVPTKGDAIRTDMIKTLQANLWITIARFRQLGVPAADLQRLFNTYPLRGLSPDAAALHEGRETIGRFANAPNKPIQLPANSRWEVRQDATGDIWSLHPST